MQTVDANVYVCTRCQTAVNVVRAPTRQRRSLWWSRRGGLGLGGATYFTPGKYVCGLCGSGTIVPAGTPRGQKILGDGVTVTGHLNQRRKASCLGCGCLVVIALGFFGILASIKEAVKTPHNDDTKSIEAPPVENPRKAAPSPEKLRIQPETAPLISEKPTEVPPDSSKKNDHSQPKATQQIDSRLNSLENIPLPVIVIVTDPIELLDASGKDVPIAVNTVIKIEKRAPLGTLTMKINNAIYAGNESRLINKVRLR
jgi:hypothetical protein